MSSPRMHRRLFLQQFLAALGGAGLPGLGCEPKEVSVTPSVDTQTKRMPVLFVGHGSPQHGFSDNRWSRGFKQLGQGFRRPRVILSISAHWYVDGSWLTANRQPKTIHDFYGFPQKMYEVSYSAAGDRDLARNVQGLLNPADSELRTDWGLDHGTWCVLRHTYPAADIPVVQLSIDRRLSPSQIQRLVTPLKDLRYDNVLIFASGNLTHNLRDAFSRMGDSEPVTPDWARRFDQTIVDALAQHDVDRLLRLWPETDDARIAHPSPDHWLPLIYALSVTDLDDTIQYPIEGFDSGSLSMRSVQFG